jgi:hypothetical protein
VTRLRFSLSLLSPCLPQSSPMPAEPLSLDSRFRLRRCLKLPAYHSRCRQPHLISLPARLFWRRFNGAGLTVYPPLRKELIGVPQFTLTDYLMTRRRMQRFARPLPGLRRAGMVGCWPASTTAWWNSWATKPRPTLSPAAFRRRSSNVPAWGRLSSRGPHST